MSEMDQILAMIRGQQGGMGGNNLATSMGPRNAPPSFGGGFQTGAQPQPIGATMGGGSSIPGMDIAPGGQSYAGQAFGGGNGGMPSMPGSFGGQQGGGQMGMLQALLQMLGHGQSGGMGLRQPPGNSIPGMDIAPGGQAQPGQTFGGQPGRMYAGGNPNFSESGGYQAKPFSPPGMPGGYPGPVPNTGMGNGFGAGQMGPLMGQQTMPQRRPLPVTLAQMGGMGLKAY